MNLWPQEWKESDEKITVGAVLERDDGTRQPLWYRFPITAKTSLTRSCDPFVLGSVFTTMRSGKRLTVHGSVSPSLLRNLDEFQSAWSLWHPGFYKKVDITADREQEPPKSETFASVMGFSGGVDSSFTALRHRKGHAGRQQRNIVAGVMAHGFDIPLNEAEAFAGAAEKARKMLASLDMEFIPVVTNFRDLKDVWEHTFTTGVASCLALLQGRFAAGVMASSYAYSHLVLAHEANPLTDPMMSSDSFPIIHDGAGFLRLDKTREVAQWPEARKYLRVCWEGKQKDRNCCHCQKCITNILYFRIAGQQHMECFERDLTDDDIARIRYHDTAMTASSQRLINVARAEGVNASWVHALEVSLRRHRWRHAWKSFRRRACHR